MHDLATTAHAGVPAAQKPGKQPRISPRVKRAIDLIVTGEVKFQKDAAAAVGMTPEHLCRELKKPHVGVFADQRARETIASLKIRAAGRLGELIRAQSEHVSLDATKHTLAIGGIKPPENGTNISITNNIAPGYVIKLRHAEDGGPVIDHAQVQDGSTG